MSTPTPTLTPERVLHILNGHQQTAALKTAVELEVFTAIGEGANTSDALAARCQASARGLRILCDFLCISGLLTKAEGVYGLAPDAAFFLDKRSPAYLGSVTRFLAADMIVQGFQGLTEVVRKGGTVMSENGSMEPEHPAWVEFANTMAPMMMGAARDIAALMAQGGIGGGKVLDIAAGHGLYGIALAQTFPAAQITALDWTAVLEVAKANAAKAGVGDRLHTIAGSAFDVDLGGPYDIVLVPNFFHHFDIPTCTTLAAKIHKSLAAGGRMLTVEFVPNTDRITPPASASFAIIMLTSTAKGDAYTFAEYDEMFRAAGFSNNEIHQLAHSPEQLIVSQR